MRLLKALLLIGILFIIGIAIFGTIPLVKNEWQNGDICPKLIGIPACYIIMTSFILALIGHLGQNKFFNLIFFFGVVPALSIATYGSLGELFNFASCPKTTSGTPMCFISFGIFFSLFILKFWSIRISKNLKPSST